jgi:hypothetical protein
LVGIFFIIKNVKIYIMGQRHQIYIRIENPLKKDVKGELWNDDDKKSAELYYGTGKYSIIPFHHQWLYGATAAGMLVNIMKDVHRSKGERHPFSPDFIQMPYYTNWNDREKKRGYGLIDFIQQMITITDFDVSEIAGRFGVERTHYIGDEHYDYEKEVVRGRWINHQKVCDHGDNNDGVMIIDVPSKKYCFMNIFEYNEEYKEGIHSLPSLQPVSAVDYVRAYYPTTKATLGEYELKGRHNGDKMSKDELKKHIQETLEYNREVVKGIQEIVKDFEVLSLKEVKSMFRRTYNLEKKRLARKEAEKTTA